MTYRRRETRRREELTEAGSAPKSFTYMDVLSVDGTLRVKKGRSNKDSLPCRLRFWDGPADYWVADLREGVNIVLYEDQNSELGTDDDVDVNQHFYEWFTKKNRWMKVDEFPVTLPREDFNELFNRID